MLLFLIANATVYERPTVGAVVGALVVGDAVVVGGGD